MRVLSLCTQNTRFTKFAPQTVLLWVYWHHHPLRCPPRNRASHSTPPSPSPSISLPSPFCPPFPKSLSIILLPPPPFPPPSEPKAPSSTSGPPQCFPAGLPAEMPLGASPLHTPFLSLCVNAVGNGRHYFTPYTDKGTEARERLGDLPRPHCCVVIALASGVGSDHFCITPHHPQDV